MSEKVNFVLKNSLGQEFVLGNNWMPLISAATNGYVVNPKYQRAGGLAAGDDEIGPRTVTFSWLDAKEDHEEYIAALNSIRYITRRAGRPCYLEERRSGFRQEVVRESSGETPNEGAWRHIGKKIVGFHLLDGNWQTIDAATAETPDWLTNGQSLVVNNPELEDVDCVITVIPQTTIASFTLQNSANQNGLTINNSSFRPGKQIIIDGTDYGEVRMNGVSIKMSMVAGSTFIRLAPGLNPIVYTSTDGFCKLQISFRPEREEI